MCCWSSCRNTTGHAISITARVGNETGFYFSHYVMKTISAKDRFLFFRKLTMLLFNSYKIIIFMFVMRTKYFVFLALLCSKTKKIFCTHCRWIFLGGALKHLKNEGERFLILVILNSLKLPLKNVTSVFSSPIHMIDYFMNYLYLSLLKLFDIKFEVY